MISPLISYGRLQLRICRSAHFASVARKDLLERRVNDYKTDLPNRYIYRPVLFVGIPAQFSAQFVRRLSTDPIGNKEQKALVSNAAATEAPTQLTRWQRVKKELSHYYHGFRLFFVELKIAGRLLIKVFSGKTLTRRERRHFIRTAADIFRIVPFAIFIVVPFLEFLLPFYLKFFPGMLPSTFTEESKRQEKLRKQMGVKLQVAKFLQDTLEETALRSKHKGSPEDIKQFTEFMHSIRTTGKQPTNEEMMRFAALLEDELTLESLNHLQLVCLCQLLNLSSVGPDYVLRLQIQLRLRLLRIDDRLIQREGVELMSSQELQKACRDRGMCYTGIKPERLKSQLKQWIDFHLNRRIPVTLLLLSRSFYLPNTVSPEKALTDTIAHLPADVEKIAARKLAESSGVRVENKEKLEEVRKEEEAIAQENKEIEEVKEEEKSAVEGTEQAPKTAAEEPSPAGVDLPIPDTEAVARRLASALIDIASKKHIDLSELQVDEFEEDVKDYMEDKPDDQERSVRLMTRKINTLLKHVNDLSAKLHKKELQLKACIESGENNLAAEPPNGVSTSEIDVLSSKRQDLVNVKEMLATLQGLETKADSLDQALVVDIIKRLDLDGDNHIAIADVLQVLEYIHSSGGEHSRQKLQEIAELVEKEKPVENN